MPIAGFQIEVVLSVLAGTRLKGAPSRSILPNRRDPVSCCGLRFVAFGSEDDLAVVGFETETKFAVLAGVEFKLGHVFAGCAGLRGLKFVP